VSLELVKFNSARENKIERILIVRLSAMGDVIHTLPAVHYLREAFPEAHIGWLIEDRWAELLCAQGAARRGAPTRLRPLVDEIHAVSLRAWGRSLLSVSTLQRMATVWNDVRDARYDVAIDLQGAIRSAVLANWSGARTIYGAAEPREAPASIFYTRKVVQRGRHVIEQNLSVAAALAGDAARVSAPDNRCDFPLDAGVEERIGRQLAGDGIREFAILNPGAGWGAKRWPAKRYGEVAQGLAKRGVCSIVNYGPGEEALAKDVERASSGTACVMSCTITGLISLTRRARLFVGGDTGPLHLAAALRIPVVGIYGPTDPARNGPYGTRSVVLRGSESVTSHARKATADEGMLGIGSEAVVAAAERLLAEEPRG
jgi:heptosyltransferase-1